MNREINERLDDVRALLESFKPPANVAKAAARGLEYRRKQTDKAGLTPAQAAKAGIGSGVQRAVNLKNRDRISLKVIKQMNAFFARHAKNAAVDAKHRGEPWKDKGYVAWLLWGGDAGRSWARKVLKKQLKEADEGGLSVREVVERWRRGERAGNGAVLWYPARELWPYREHTWTRDTARPGLAWVEGQQLWLDGDVKWDALRADMQARGWDEDEPLLMRVGRNGVALLGEGNHRLAIARELDLMVPVELQFEQRVVNEREVMVRELGGRG